MPEFTGYNPRAEERAKLIQQCLDFDIMSLSAAPNLPPTRGIKDLMRRDDQGRMSSCTGFGMTNAAEVTGYLQTGIWKQYNPLWSYRRGQEVSNIRGDNGATIHGVVEAAKKKGLLPEDTNDDGKPEYPYVVQYSFQFPQECYTTAAKFKIGYSLNLNGFDAILRFLQSNQGAVVVGGAWGNWHPNSAGICDRFIGGGGGHCRAYIDWITINNKVYLVEINSHYKQYGVNGYAYHSKTFVDGQAKDKNTATIGVSDLSGPAPRVIDWAKELAFVPTLSVPSSGSPKLYNPDEGPTIPTSPDHSSSEDIA